MPQRLLVVLPGLLALPDAALMACAPLAALARTPPAAQEGGLEIAMLDCIGSRASCAPLALLGAGGEPGTDYTLHADPVALVAGHDDVRLLGRVDDLAPDDADALRALLAAHFAEDGLRFDMPRPDAWFVRLAHVPDLSTTPLAAARGRALAELLPRGHEGRTWRRWQNEIQMLLHEHPVNLRRAAEGRAPVAGIWFWGGGTLIRPAAPAPVDVLAPRSREGDPARGLALASGGSVSDVETGAPLDRWLAATTNARGVRATPNDPDGRRLLAVAPPFAKEPDLARIARDWLAPAAAWLRANRNRSVVLLADGGDAAVAWISSAPSLAQRLRGALVGTRPALPPRETA